MLSFVLPNLVLGRLGEPVAVVQNLFFLVSNAIIISSGQLLSFRAQREMILNQLVIEGTKARLEEAHEELKRLDRFKSQFFANITHELKTPLAMILTPLEMLLQAEGSALAPAERSTLQLMFRSGLKLLRMIGDLLDLSKLEESKLRLRIAEHDLIDHLRGLVAQAQPLAQRKRITLSLQAEVQRCAVNCDLERMERVFINLLSNALKFTADGGRVLVKLSDLGASVRVEVSDDGVGFPPELAERLFERFFQVDMGGTRAHGGTGIGLALARELVELHGGRIWAEGEEGRGARFFVELRKGREHLPAQVLDRRAARSEMPGGQRSADKGLTDWVAQVTSRSEFKLLDIDELTDRRVVDRDPDEDQRPYTALVVEDTPAVVRIVHAALRQQFKVLTAPDGLKGLELALQKQPDLVVTDLMMPGIDGLELTRRLRADARTRHVPIVMLTARGSVDDRVVGLESGVNAYLAKPFSARELLTCARSLLDIQQTTAELVMTQRVDSLQIVAGGLAHEINNPLNYVKAGLERVGLDVRRAVSLCRESGQRPLSAAEQAEVAALQARTDRMLETASAGLRRIAGTVELLGTYGREGYVREARPHDVFADLATTVDLVRKTIHRGVTVQLETSGDGRMECVPEELNQLVTNLTQNAIEAAPEGTGTVKVRGVGEADEVVLTVEDDGPGLKPEDQRRIFTPFFTTKAPGRGMGLGLTIVWRVVQSLGGTIKVDSKPGAGTLFTVRLPRSQRTARAAG